MSNWKEYTLEELCDFQNGFAFKNSDYVDSSENTNEVFRMGYINRGGGFKEDTTPVFVPQNYPKNLDKFILKLNDITIAMTDMKNSMALLGYCARISHNNRFVLNQRVGRIRVVRNDILDPIYLYYYLNSSKQIDYLRANANSGVQVNLGTDTIKKSILKIPSIEKQREIANILFALDQKIELNTQINQTLEQIAQALFKSWFVDFDPVRAKVQALSDGLSLEQAELAAMQAISGKTAEELTALSQAQPDRYAELAKTVKAFPCEIVEIDGVEVPKGWEYKLADELFDIGIGKTPPRKETEWFSTNPDDMQWISIKDMGNSGVFITESSEFLTNQAVDKFNIRKIPENTVLLSFKLTIGRVSITTCETTTNEAIAHFKITDKSFLTTEYLYLFFQQFDFNSLGSTSSIATAVNSKTIKGIEILIPNEELIKAFQIKISNIFAQIKNLTMENKNLVETRDLLLPKLLNWGIL